MNVTLNLSPELTARLSQEALRRGLTVPELSLELLRSGLPSTDDDAESDKLLEQWVNGGDADEQYEQIEYLIRISDEGRLVNKKAVLTELRGMTW